MNIDSGLCVYYYKPGHSAKLEVDANLPSQENQFNKMLDADSSDDEAPTAAPSRPLPRRASPQRYASLHYNPESYGCLQHFLLVILVRS